MKRKLLGPIGKRLLTYPLFRRLYWNAAPRIRSTWHCISHGRIDCPFEFATVDPNTIEYYSGRTYPRDGDIRRSFGTVRGGSWDQPPLRSVFPYKTTQEISSLAEVEATNDLILPSFLERYKEGKQWPETALYQYVIKCIDDGKSTWHDCTSEADVNLRCRRIDRLHESMKRGYRSQCELARDGVVAKSFVGAMENEIIVDMGRGPSYLHIDGIHRLAMARILNLDEIPVAIVTKHERIAHNSGEKQQLGRWHTVT